MNNYKEISFDNFMKLIDDFNTGEEKKFASDIKACCGDIVNEDDFIDFFSVKKIDMGWDSYFIIAMENGDPVIIEAEKENTPEHFLNFFNRVLGVNSVYCNDNHV